MTVSALNRVHYLVGPNGSGKTRYLLKRSQELKGYFIPKFRQQPGVNEIPDNDFKQFVGENAHRPEQIN